MGKAIAVSRICDLISGDYGANYYVAIDTGNKSEPLKKMTLGEISSKSGPPGPPGQNGAPGANGADGISPTISIVDIVATQSKPKGVRITISDVTHPLGTSVDIYDGAGTNNVFLDATGEGATDESVLPETGLDNTLYIIKERITDDGKLGYSLYTWDSNKIADTSSQFPDNSKYIIINPATLSAKDTISSLDSINARIDGIYATNTICTGSISSSYELADNSGGYLWTQFKPNMDMVLEQDKTNFSFMLAEDVECTEFIVSLYEFDFETNLFSWVADSGNYTTLKAGTNAGKFKHVKDNSYTLEAGKLYCTLVLTNATNLNIAGEPYSNDVVTYPSLGMRDYNIYSLNPTTDSVANGILINKEALSMAIPKFSAGSGIPSRWRMFLSIANMEIKTASSPSGNNPFIVMPSGGEQAYAKTSYSPSSYKGIVLDSNNGVLFQKVVPVKDVYVSKWSIIDSSEKANESSIGSYILDEDMHVICSPSGDGITASLVEESLYPSSHGTMYTHTYAIDNSENILLHRNASYWFPMFTNPGNGDYYSVTVYDNGNIVYGPITDSLVIQDITSITADSGWCVAHGTHVSRMTIYDTTGNSYDI